MAAAGGEKKQNGRRKRVKQAQVFEEREIDRRKAKTRSRTS